jgi:hypothetical protein
LSDTLHNPAVPGSLLPSLTAASPLVAYHQRTTNAPRTQLIGVGPERNFVNVWDSIDHQPGFPARPTPGTIIDLDLILEKCDLDTNKVSGVSQTFQLLVDAVAVCSGLPRIPADRRRTRQWQKGAERKLSWIVQTALLRRIRCAPSTRLVTASSFGKRLRSITNTPQTIFTLSRRQ